MPSFAFNTQAKAFLAAHETVVSVDSRAVPYRGYDITDNVGWVSIGTDHDTLPLL